MKRESLMIGDWVYVPHDGNVTHYGQVKAIYESYISVKLGDDSWAGVAEALKPVPLTAEILEKNGFESDTNMFGLCYYELSKSYIIDNRGDRFCFVKRFPGLRDSTFHVIDVKYVHELQHALRLCGISKEIVL